MNNAKKGDWVQIHQIVLNLGERAPQVPDDTKNVPLELWVKGFAKTDANLGDLLEIETVTGRTVTGTLKSVNPGYTHDYGNYIPELQKIAIQVKEILFGGTK